MMNTQRRRLALIVLVVTAFSSLALGTQAASAFSSDDSLFPFAYTLNASTHLKKLNQTITVPPGSFIGAIDLDDATLQGAIKLPAAKFTFTLAGVGLVTATAKIVPTKPVTGTIDFGVFPYAVVATATFNVRIVSAYAGIVPVNLVGNNCVTSTPVSVTMKTAATFSGPVAPFAGVYTLPPLKTCGTATAALNLVIPGPGNTFTATATRMTG